MLPNWGDAEEVRLLPALVARAVDGDERAVQFVLPGFARRIFLTVRRMHLRYDETEDACAEALARAWSALPNLRDPTTVLSWLDRLAVHAGRQILRRRLYEASRMTKLASLNRIPTFQSDAILARELRTDLGHLLGDEAAALLWAVKCEGRSIREVADAARRGERAVRKDLRKAIELARTRGDSNRRELFLRVP